MTARPARRIAALLSLAMAAALCLVAFTLAGGSASAATVTNQICMPTEYAYKIRNVTHKAPVWSTYRVNWQAFGVRRTIARGTSLTNSSSSNVQNTAHVSASISGTYKEDAIIESVEVKASLSAEYKRTWGSTSSESRTVTTSETMTVPAGTTLITFKARKVVRGTYQLSTCERQPGQSVRFGMVVWRTHNFSVYSTNVNRGDWTCAEKAQIVPELQAQRAAGCF